MNRREFLRNGVVTVAGAAGLAVLLSGCGASSAGAGGDNATKVGGQCLQNGSPLETTGETENHTHTIQISAAEIAAANPNAVFTTSDEGHTHPVQLTAEQYQALAINIGVALSTGQGGDGHVHSLVINCA